MRLLIKLKSLKDCAYDIAYYPKMQGFVYSLLRGTDYANLHDSKAYKFFSFSNIFPAKDFKSGDERQFLISSPDEKLIETFKNKLASLEKVSIGEMLFKIKEIAALNPKIASSCTLKTGTPIVIRIPKENYAKYGISPPSSNPLTAATYLYQYGIMKTKSIHVRLPSKIFEEAQRIVDEGLFSSLNEFVKESVRKGVEEYGK